MNKIENTISTINLIACRWETQRLDIKDSNLDEIEKLNSLYTTANDHMKKLNGKGVGEPTKKLLEGDLPPKGKKELYRIQSIYQKNTNSLIGCFETYYGYPTKGSVYIVFVYFDSSHQRKGFGKELINNFLINISKLGYKEIVINVDLKNWSGIKFWTGLGFNNIIQVCGDDKFSDTTFANFELKIEI